MREGGASMDEQKLIERITIDPRHFGGKPIIRGHRLAVEHVLGMLDAGSTSDELLEGYPWLEPDDIEACLLFRRRMAGPEFVVPRPLESNREAGTG